MAPCDRLFKLNQLFSHYAAVLDMYGRLKTMYHIFSVTRYPVDTTKICIYDLDNTQNAICIPRNALTPRANISHTTIYLSVGSSGSRPICAINGLSLSAGVVQFFSFTF